MVAKKNLNYENVFVCHPELVGESVPFSPNPAKAKKTFLNILANLENQKKILSLFESRVDILRFLLISDPLAPLDSTGFHRIPQRAPFNTSSRFWWALCWVIGDLRCIPKTITDDHTAYLLMLRRLVEMLFFSENHLNVAQDRSLPITMGMMLAAQQKVVHRTTIHSVDLDSNDLCQLCNMPFIVWNWMELNGIWGHRIQQGC